jgi:hypothetical protein
MNSIENCLIKKSNITCNTNQTMSLKANKTQKNTTR